MSIKGDLAEYRRSQVEVIKTAILRMQKAKREVTLWMQEQGTLGNLVTNNQAPAWKEYEEATIAFHTLAEKLYSSTGEEL